ncbi:hypothetical protein FC07_GL001133 [Loigolactobacillus bifermentans DSM 20003]|uniref:Uncharacterized protein n=2 Tax=Loigolactobacillus bifermentans TaxID=1607 RepID=A0A0R1H1B6_9LACO|nr:hypothetical protein FC07_GL001133 [Loigolactobacillus bifermentans DSM 20003]
MTVLMAISEKLIDDHQSYRHKTYYYLKEFIVMNHATLPFHFQTLITKTETRFEIQFLDFPGLTAEGEIYLEAQYYAYRVLGSYLRQLTPEALTASQEHPAPTPHLTNQDFLVTIQVPTDLDPHQMQAHFDLPQTAPQAEITKIKRLIDDAPLTEDLHA